MNSRRYSKFHASLVTSLIIFLLFINPALAAAPNNNVNETERNPSFPNSSISVNDAPPLALEFTQQTLMLPGDTIRVSVDSSGAEGNDHSQTPSISADGRYMAFQSDASNLVSGDTNGTSDVFIHDVLTNTTTRVSVASDGTQGDGYSSGSLTSAFSADGRYVVFSSFATNLVSGDTNGRADIFVRDLQANTTTRVSVASDGTQANNDSFHPAISANGRYVAFGTGADNLVSGDLYGVFDIFVRDLQANTTARISVASDGTQGNGSSDGASFTADGRYVAFQSLSSNLVGDDTNGLMDVFIHDILSNTTTRVSIASDGAQANGHSYDYRISADGRYVAFQSMGTNLVVCHG